MNHSDLQNAVFTAAVTSIGGKAQVWGEGNCPPLPQCKTAPVKLVLSIVDTLLNLSETFPYYNAKAIPSNTVT